MFSMFNAKLPDCQGCERRTYRSGRTTRFALRPLPPCVAGESDSTASDKNDDWAALGHSSASESDSAAGRAGRGLVACGGGESSQRIFFTCHARWQGSSRTMPCALSSVALRVSVECVIIGRVQYICIRMNTTHEF